VGGAYVLLALLVLVGVLPWLALLALLTLPMATQLVRMASIYEAPARLNKVLRGTAKLHERFGWLVIAGVVAAIVAGVR
jgi:1,4-dihydroxy-2-naphthoate octaprenyltransferase